MYPFDAEPNPNVPAPPSYELSQQDYDVKLSEAVQQSLRLTDTAPRPASSWQTWDEATNATAQQQATHPTPPSSYQLGRADSSGGSHHSRNSLSGSSASSSSGGRHQKERPSWYHEAGLGERNPSRGLVASPSNMYGQHPNSPHSNSPGAEVYRRSPYQAAAPNHYNQLLDEEGGIDNPPPPFSAANGAPTPIAAGFPVNAIPPRGYGSPSSQTSPSSDSHHYSSRRSSVDVNAPPSHLRPPSAGGSSTTSGDYFYPRDAGSGQRHGRRRTGSFAAAQQPGVQNGVVTSNPNGPLLAFDKNMAYGGGSTTTTRAALPAGAAPAINPSEFYSSAVSAALKARLPANTSYQPSNPTTTSPYAASIASSDSSYFTSSRQPSQPASTTAYSSYAASTVEIGPSPTNTTFSQYGQQQAYSQPQPPRAASAQGRSTYSFNPQVSAPQSLSTGDSRRSSQETLHVRPASRSSVNSGPTSVSMGQRPTSSASNRTSFQQAPPTSSSAAAYASGGSVPGSGSYSLYGYAAQQKRQSNGFYPAQIAAPAGSPIRAPPGAAAPANVYERRFS